MVHHIEIYIYGPTSISRRRCRSCKHVRVRVDGAGYTKHRSFSTTAHVTCCHCGLSIEKTRRTGWLRKTDYFTSSTPVISAYSSTPSPRRRPMLSTSQNFMMIFLLVLLHVKRISRSVSWLCGQLLFHSNVVRSSVLSLNIDTKPDLPSKFTSAKNSRWQWPPLWNQLNADNSAISERIFNCFRHYFMWRITC